MNKTVDKEINIINGSPVFLGVAGISIFNTLFFYLNFSFVVYFGLGITQVIDYIGFEQNILGNKIIFIIISIILSMLFIIIDYFSKKNNKVIFWFGFILYLIDTIIFLYIIDIISILGHIAVLKLLYDSKNKQS